MLSLFGSSNKTAEFLHQFIGSGNEVVNVSRFSGVRNKLMRQLARNTLRFGPMPGEDQPDSTPEKGVSCPVKDDTGMPFRVLFESAPGLYLVLTPDEFSIVAVSEAY